MNDKYNIQLASKISGVGVHTIRAWEKRYKAVSPIRSAKGRREYVESEVLRLKLLSKLCHMGHSIGQIASIETSELEKMLSKLDNKIVGIDSKKMFAERISDDELEISKFTLEMAVNTFKLDIINYELSKLKNALSPKDFVFNVIDSLVQLVHQKVNSSELSVAQKHSLYSLLKFQMEFCLHLNTESVIHSKPTFMIMANENLLDEVYTLSSALLCSQYGLNFISLPDKLASQSIIDTCQLINADQLIFPCFKSKVAPSRRDLTQTISKLIDCCQDHQKVVILGNADFDYQRFSGLKKFTYLKDLKALDKYLTSVV